MKRLRRISLILAAFGAAVLLSRFWAVPLADWAVRAAGTLTLISLFALAFTTARLRGDKKAEVRREDRT